MSFISVRGAREHNLKNLDIDIPRDKLVVLTGVSGSGKSSLAFDTIYAEGQRRYVESLSAYARQFLNLMQKPDVDSIDGLSPAISIDQKTTSHNPRSTVGTVTEIYDYLRLLFARVGVPYSPATGLPITSQTISQMVDRIMAMGDGKRLHLLAPIVRGRKGEYRKELQDLRQKGFQRVRIDGTVHTLDALPTLDKNQKHDIEVVVDRVVVRDDIATRLADSIETALRLSDGLLYVEDVDSGVRQQEKGGSGEKTAGIALTPPDARPLTPAPPAITIFSEKFACPVSGFTLAEIEPRLFSFNSPHGACPACDGLGKKLTFDPDLIVPDSSLSLLDGAVAPWAGKGSAPAVYYTQTLEAVARHFKASPRTPWAELPQQVRHAILYGTGKEKVQIRYDDGFRTYETDKPFPGVIAQLDKRWRETESNWSRDDLSQYQIAQDCASCHGHRLKPEALAVKIAGQHIGAITALSIGAAATWFADLEPQLSGQQQDIARRILKEVRERLQFLLDVGLDYLTLARGSSTLSGGESQRIRLASQIGSGLTGVLYVLDEPSIGLHQRDNDRLLATLRHLRDLGNTVLVVEHDEDAMHAADHLIDIGPGAGRHGGQLVTHGTPAEVMAHPDSLTGAWLAGRASIPVPATRRTGHVGKQLVLKQAAGNNLQGVDMTVPLGTLTCVTGVSGSGKSTLVLETLFPALQHVLHKTRDTGNHQGLRGAENLDKVIDIDQSPIGRTPRSNPATYIGVFTAVRDWFAGLPESKARGYKPGRFSFNVKGGRCEACEGDGVIKIEMHFLPDVFVTCEQCKGKRYNRETLEIVHKGQSIADVLDMTVDDAVEFFSAMTGVADKLRMLQQVGLGYIHLGQAANTLSGGEAQRVKLAKELSRRSTGRTIYILDEPTTGLHFADVTKLLEVLHKLVEQGNTVLVIEHNLDVIKTADWVIDLGPEGGTRGGHIIATGTPEEVASVAGSHTGRYLHRMVGERMDKGRTEFSRKVSSRRKPE
jgi:excinuclease ABC subunit A